MKRYFYLIVILQLFLGPCCQGMNDTISAGDRNVLNKFWQYAEKQGLKKLPIEERIPIIAHFFIQTPYQGGTLNVDNKERLVINLQALDCVTFVENVLALALLPDYLPECESLFLRNLQKIRYREGNIEDYCSRLHYSSDWLYDLEQRRIIQDVTKEIEGIPFQPNVFYMSKNYTLYPQLKQDTSLVYKIKEVEQNINKRSLYYIPKSEIAHVYTKIKHGDILLITTNIKGLDTSHLGFAYKKQGVVYLLHASSTAKQVVLSTQPLQEYMANIRSQTGVMVGRIIPPL